MGNNKKIGRKRNSKANNLSARICELILLNLFFVILFVLLGQIILAISFNCSITNAGSCIGTGNLTVFKLMNETSGSWNAHAQNATLASYSPMYGYSVCCNSDSVLSSNCGEATVIKMFNWTNSHIQTGNYNGIYTIYNYSACLSAEPGTVSCTYSQSSCPANYACLGSMASSEAWATNTTNSHVGPCGEYLTKICCALNSPPVISNVILNSTFGTNYTNENLTVYFSESDADGDSYTNITDWRKEGVSIAVLNMPFDTNVSSNSIGAIRDYSTYGNNGTLGGGTSANMPTWNSSGKVGGAYEFDGSTDYIEMSSDPDFTIRNAGSIALWARPRASLWDGSVCDIVVKGGVSWAVNDYNLFLFNGKFYGTIANGTDSLNMGGPSTDSVSMNNWYHVVFTWDTNAQTAKIYLNGRLNSTVSTAIVPRNTQTILTIGRDNGYDGYYYNGSLDEVQILNYSLSASQIQTIYNAGVANHSVQMLHSDETTKWENWSVAVTGNDKLNDGTTVLSNTLMIRYSAPNVILLSPSNGNTTRLRTPTFIWNASHPDSAPMSYEINITPINVSGQTLCSDNIYVYLTSAMNYTPSVDLKCFYDNGFQYTWKVRANDSVGYGPWTDAWGLNMTAVVDMSMPVSSISFGTIPLLGYNDTTDNSPPPFKIQNDGNALINISTSATNLWESIINPSNYYKFKVNVSEEAGSFQWNNSATSWTQMPAPAVNVSSIIGLKYPDISDSAIIDIYVEVPLVEPPNEKNSTITFMSILGE